MLEDAQSAASSEATTGSGQMIYASGRRHSSSIPGEPCPRETRSRRKEEATRRLHRPRPLAISLHRSHRRRLWCIVRERLPDRALKEKQLRLANKRSIQRTVGGKSHFPHAVRHREQTPKLGVES